MENKEVQVLDKWQLDIIKRLPTSKQLKEQILREQYGVDWLGNNLSKERQLINIKRKKSKRKIKDSDFKDQPSGEEDTVITDA